MSFPALPGTRRTTSPGPHPSPPSPTPPPAPSRRSAESKSDWAFHCVLLGAIQKRAKERGLSTFKDRSGKTRRLDRVYDELTFGGRYPEDGEEDFLREILEMTTNLGDVGWDELKEKGFARYTGVGMDFVSIGNATDIEPNETITAKHVAHGKEASLADPHPAYAVLHRPPLLPRAGRGAARPQGSARRGRRPALYVWSGSTPATRSMPPGAMTSSSSVFSAGNPSW